MLQAGSPTHDPLFDESSVGNGGDRILHLQAKRLSRAGIAEGRQEASQQICQGCLVFGLPPTGADAACRVAEHRAALAPHHLFVVVLADRQGGGDPPAERK